MTQNSQFIVNGDGTVTIRAEFTHDLTIAQKTVNDAVHYLWDHGIGDHGTPEEPIAWDDLTNQNKLTILVSHWKRVTMDAAKAYDVSVGQAYEYNPFIHGIG